MFTLLTVVQQMVLQGKISVLKFGFQFFLNFSQSKALFNWMYWHNLLFSVLHVANTGNFFYKNYWNKKPMLLLLNQIVYLGMWMNQGSTFSRGLLSVALNKFRCHRNREQAPTIIFQNWSSLVAGIKSNWSCSWLL